MDENTTYDDLIMRFGKPQLLADSFIEEYDENILRKKNKAKKDFTCYMCNDDIRTVCYFCT